MKLPEDFKKKWVDALRSGKYKQGSGQLYNEEDDSYCCLGVAAHMSGCRNFRSNSYIYSSMYRENEIPSIIMGSNSIPTELANMNDGGQSFKDIANWIEQNL